MSWYDYGLLGLFGVCFVSSTIYPLGSEAFVLGFAAFDFDLFSVWVVASVGNTLGSLSTYYLAYFGGERWAKKLAPKEFSQKDFSLASQSHVSLNNTPATANAAADTLGTPPPKSTPTPKPPLKLRIYAWLEGRRESVGRFGFVYAFFVFLPIVGDVFALLLGLVRYNQILCIMGIALGKAARYALLLAPFWW